MYYVYMLRCKDNSLYTGITTNISRRMEEHFSKNEKCAKYTFHHDVLKLEKLWTTENRSLASKLEFNIKKLNKLQKENLIINDDLFEKLLSDHIECDKYICISNELKQRYVYEKKKKR